MNKIFLLILFLHLAGFVSGQKKELMFKIEVGYGLNENAYSDDAATENFLRQKYLGHFHDMSFTLQKKLNEYTCFDFGVSISCARPI